MFSAKLGSLCFTHEAQARDCDLFAWGSPLKRSQVCEERLYMEALDLAQLCSQDPSLPARPPLHGIFSNQKQDRCFPSTTVCISSLGIACTRSRVLHFVPRDCLHKKLCAAAPMMSSSHLRTSCLALWGRLALGAGKVPVSWWEGQPVIVMRAQLEVLGWY